MAAFEDLGVLQQLVNAITDLDWTLPTDIQYEGIPAILGGGDVCMAAETGSGKTGAFCIPILQIVYESMQPKSISSQKTNPGQIDVDRRSNQPMCLIVEPTKELAQQTHAQIERFGAYLDKPKIKNVLAVSGVHMGELLRAIGNGCDILTCTPGRIRGLVQERRVDLSQVRFFVLDEADSLLGGQSDSAKIIHELYNHIPKCGPSGQRLQMIVCSATLHNMAVQKLANQYMHFPQWIDLKGQDSVPETVHQVVCLIDPKEDKSWIRLRSQPGKSVQTDNIHGRDQIRPGTDNAETLSEAVKILKAEYVLKAINEHKMDQCIIFCRTKLDCDNLERFLAPRGHTCACLHSDRSPNERTANLQLFKEKKVKFLICTDVAARGLDISGVPYVINVTLPPAEEKANYVHRIGRVGRAERMGLAISLVSTVPEKVWYHQCRSRGVNCFQTNLVSQGGCAKWYNETSYLGEIEEHLGITINRIGPEMEVPMDEYDGKVVYGTKKAKEGGPNLGHAVEMTGIVGVLSHLEREVQWAYLELMNGVK